MSSPDPIDEKVAYLESILDLSCFLDEDANSPEKIRSYYKINRPAYQRFHSDKGFMHFRVSLGNELGENDIYYQPEKISSFIEPGARVLELGSGNGANLAYLARKHPTATFVGVDLSPIWPKNPPENLQLKTLNYVDLSAFEDNSFDVVYAIETLVHSSNKLHIFEEARRVLKPDGVFIIYEYALSRPYETYRRSHQAAIQLISRCGACAIIEDEAYWSQMLRWSCLFRESETDFGPYILPDLKRLERKAEHILRHHCFAKLFFRIFPKQFTGNILIGYLGYAAFISGEARYVERIYRKRF